MSELTSFVTATAAFKAGRSSLSAFLDRCLARLGAVEPTLQAFVQVARNAAKTAAAAADARWTAGKPLSAIDGMPIRIKDILGRMDGEADPFSVAQCVCSNWGRMEGAIR